MAVGLVRYVIEEMASILYLEMRAPLAQALLLPAPWNNFLTCLPARISLQCFHCTVSGDDFLKCDDNRDDFPMTFPQRPSPRHPRSCHLSSFGYFQALSDPGTRRSPSGPPTLSFSLICAFKCCLFFEASSVLISYMLSIAPSHNILYIYHS